jgi:hypothetical protein
MIQLTERQLQLSVAFSIIIIFYILLGFLILRRDKKYFGNQLYAISFWMGSLSLIFNLIYLFSTNIILIRVLNLASIISLNATILILSLAVMVIYKGKKEFLQSKVTYFVIMVFIVLVVIQSIISNGIEVVFDEGDYLPKWSLFFGSYEIIIASVLTFISLHYSILLIKELRSEIRKKFTRFIIGNFLYYITFINVAINNMYIIPGFGDIAALINLLTIPGLILVYYGIIRR